MCIAAGDSLVNQSSGNVNMETVLACGAKNFTNTLRSAVRATYFGKFRVLTLDRDNSFQNGGVPATDGGCTMTRVGNSTEDCGGLNRLNF
ncbi:hypothetical protein BD410DRAFT_388792 [Rickenella mellea]|uniref:Uncharacterized protein n=1 Tax=Rickenella mellea TaxID=50990 RepID=A0A4Y7PY99_9AGAM|nr:hypothetical protein BD410DRAFT_388792 [Rickenella mellea]